MPPKKRARLVKSVTVSKETEKTNGKVSGPKVSNNQGLADSGIDNSVEKKYWLMKAEPESRIENGVDVKFGIDDLMKEPNQTACWDGVRNYQARNFMRDQMKVGDLAFFYHSNCKPPGVAGIMKIVKNGYVDHTQFDRKSAYFDPKSSASNPKWFMVDVKFERKLKRYIPIHELKKLFLQHKESKGPLENLALFTSARLSVQPLTKEQFEFIRALEHENPAAK